MYRIGDNPSRNKATIRPNPRYTPATGGGRADMLAATVPWLMVSGILSAASPATATSPTSSSLGTSEPLTLDGDVPWIVPPELSRPSEAESDALADTAQTLALRDVELDWYKVLGYRAVIYANSSFGPRSPLAKALPPAKKVAVFFGDADRHPYLEVAFNLSARGCGLERGAEAHCLLRVGGFSWQGQRVEGAVLARPCTLEYPSLHFCMAKRGTKRVLEYARLAMGFANVRASRYGIR